MLALQLVIGVCDRENWHIAGSLQRTRLAAQSETVEIIQAERHDQKVVVALRGAKQRFRRICLDIKRVFFTQDGRQPLM